MLLSDILKIREVHLELVKHPNEVLTSVCEDVKPEEVTDEIVEQMFQIMIDNNGVGLASTQVGINKRFFIYSKDAKKSNLKIVINPEIIRTGKGIEYKTEGCLSVPGKRKPLKRFEVITVKYLTRNIGSSEIKEVTEVLKYWEARIFQHELDHLNGVICIFKEEN